MTDLDAYLDPALVAAKRSPFGERWFYPPGQHPATKRQRDHLAMLQRLREKLVAIGQPTTDCDALIDYAQGLLASFEEGESIAKADYLHRVRR